MIFGKPYEFAVFYEVLEKTQDEYWKFGVFLFFIEDEIYPAKGSNYTLPMNISFLKESHKEVMECTVNEDLDFLINAHVLLKTLAHSHGLVLESDPEDFELPPVNNIGVFLSPPEVVDTGFYLFYLAVSNEQECLIYSADYGKTAQKIFLNAGIVSSVLGSLPNKELI
ncbi:immunity 42 family protein [Cronobacter turicensis]|uniref:immunity 42 family protein n=1 Tax=Cronobacter turicensis TaxID=413502 RepID=UPI0024C2AFB4|nr:immunity 42 family protein [Cronobacter turicensis]EKM0378393.1 immunity 42 family protein [Cronobacter turicensis]ELY4133025.1 immunity 42 family protein [Cronobacter turicensis]ELY4352657.1 immunity 42 family protein [Cronobacter turicensis]ELY6280513.1 immunity 42 family protein [Cronobacter turicensis]MDK1229508.1 immunity 42 family protein [Cronobacter turicensis]